MPLELAKFIIPLLTKKACPANVCCGAAGVGRKKRSQAPTLAPSNMSRARIVKAIYKGRLYKLRIGNLDFLGEDAPPKRADAEGGVAGPCGVLLTAL